MGARIARVRACLFRDARHNLVQHKTAKVLAESLGISRLRRGINRISGLLGIVLGVCSRRRRGGMMEQMNKMEDLALCFCLNDLCKTQACNCCMLKSEFNNPWIVKFFECRDCDTCLLVTCVPGGLFCAQGRAVGRALDKNCIRFYYCAVLCLTFGTAFNRSLIRRKLKLEGNCLTDCCIHLFCVMCAVCQEAQEVKCRTVTEPSANPLLSIHGDPSPPKTPQPT
mmetsp:Transcript_33908/g.59103  ORF Transcript_33908/g.59103 Transcript_33908/m.59103 type:complete len:225 (+) Transcript_33908:2377-3051(+)